MPNEVPQSPVKIRCDAAGLSQSEVARQADLDRQVVGKLYGGGRCVTRYGQLRALGAVLNAEPRDLVAPGQAVLCESVQELEDFAGERGWRCACESGQDPRAVVAEWLGLDPTDDDVRQLVESLRNSERAA